MNTEGMRQRFGRLYMNINSKKLIQWLEKQFPKDLAEDWDNVGFLLGNSDKTINKILIALDVTPEVVNEAIDKNVDLIISHHPLIFKSIKRLVDQNPHEKMIRQLIFNDIHVYAAHTNADIAEGGLTDMLLDLLKLKATEGLMSVGQHNLLEMKNNAEEHYLGRIAALKAPMTLRELAEWLKKELKISHLRIVGNPKAMAQRIGVLTGAGDDAIQTAKAKRCDVLITGDIKYHPAQEALSLGMPLIDMGHYNSEIIFKTVLKNRMVEAFERLDYDVTIEVSGVEKDPFLWI